MSKQNVAKEGVSYAIAHGAHSTICVIDFPHHAEKKIANILYFSILWKEWYVEMTNGSQMIINGREKR